MNRKTTYVLLAVLLVLAAYMLIFDQNNTEEEETSTTPTAVPLDPLLTLDTSTVTAIELVQVETGETVQVTLGDDGVWMLEGDEGGEADTDDIDTLMYTVGDLVPDTEIGTGALAADYGLDPATYTLTLTTPDGDIVLLVGPDTISYSGNYAMVEGEDRIVIISSTDEYYLTSWISSPPLAPTPTPETTATPETTDEPTATPVS